MKTINISFDVTTAELDLLKRGHCDKPDGRRIKLLLLREAYRTVRNRDEAIMHAAQGMACGPKRPKPLVARDPRDGRLKPVHVEIGTSASLLTIKRADKLARKALDHSDHSSLPTRTE